MVTSKAILALHATTTAAFHHVSSYCEHGHDWLDGRVDWIGEHLQAQNGTKTLLLTRTIVSFEPENKRRFVYKTQFQPDDNGYKVVSLVSPACCGVYCFGGGPNLFRYYLQRCLFPSVCASVPTHGQIFSVEDVQDFSKLFEDVCPIFDRKEKHVCMRLDLWRCVCLACDDWRDLSQQDQDFLFQRISKAAAMKMGTTIAQRVTDKRMVDAMFK